MDLGAVHELVQPLDEERLAVRSRDHKVVVAVRSRDHDLDLLDVGRAARLAHGLRQRLPRLLEERAKRRRLLGSNLWPSAPEALSRYVKVGAAPGNPVKSLRRANRRTPQKCSRMQSSAVSLSPFCPRVRYSRCGKRLPAFASARPSSTEPVSGVSSGMPAWAPPFGSARRTSTPSSGGRHEVRRRDAADCAGAAEGGRSPRGWGARPRCAPGDRCKRSRARPPAPGGRAACAR
jgi:hypothetical protein